MIRTAVPPRPAARGRPGQADHAALIAASSTSRMVAAASTPWAAMTVTGARGLPSTAVPAVVAQAVAAPGVAVPAVAVPAIAVPAIAVPAIAVPAIRVASCGPWPAGPPA